MKQSRITFYIHLVKLFPEDDGGDNFCRYWISECGKKIVGGLNKQRESFQTYRLADL